MSAASAPLVEADAPDVKAESLIEALLNGANELQEVQGEHVEVLHAPPTALAFARIIGRHAPVVIEGAVDHWPALEKWKTDAYIAGVLGERPITVSMTPDGLADAVRDGTFMQPLDVRLSYDKFVDLRRQSLASDVGAVLYVQLQNSNLTQEEEFSSLLADVDADVSFASEALGRKPEAVNIWIGTHLSTTSLHKDHYENLYVVVTGKKHFTLYPPTDFPFLYERSFPTGRWQRDANDGSFHKVSDSPPAEVPWIAVDPETPDFHAFPRFAHAHPIQVTVSAGEMLYIPALYYHHVKQSNDSEGRCIAVNFWWDMDFDARWANYQTAREIAALLPK